MSQNTSYNPNLRLIVKEHWEGSLESIDMDTPETLETLPKTLEDEMLTVQSEANKKDSDTQRFLDEIDRKCSKERIEELEKWLEDAKVEIESLYEQVSELEGALQGERDNNDKYFAALEMLEKENDRLREENAKLSESNNKRGKKLYIAETQISLAKKESSLGKESRELSYAPERRPRNKIDSKHEYKKSKTGMPTIGGEDSKLLSDSENNDPQKGDDSSVKKKKKYYDDVWISKLKFLKEKLISEQRRCKNLEFLVNTQKELIESANQHIFKLKVENQALEGKQEKLKSEVSSLNEARLKEKTKIDNAITFCDLIHNCSFSREEIVDKLRDFPFTVASFLRGSSDTITFNQSASLADSLIPEGAKQPSDLAGSVTKTPTKEDKNIEEMTHELDDIKHNLNSVAHFLSQAFPTIDQSVLTNLESLSKIHLSLKEGFSHGCQPIINPNLDQKDISKLGKTSSGNAIFTKAIQKSSDFLWNLRQKQRTRIKDDKENQENIPSNNLQ